MRLISKETVLNGLIDWQFTSDDDKEYATIEQMIKSIEETPTVEAIPVKWIVNWITNQTIPALHTCDYYEAVNVMLDDWEKENETN